MRFLLPQREACEGHANFLNLRGASERFVYFFKSCGDIPLTHRLVACFV